MNTELSIAFGNRDEYSTIKWALTDLFTEESEIDMVVGRCPYNVFLKAVSTFEQTYNCKLQFVSGASGGRSSKTRGTWVNGLHGGIKPGVILASMGGHSVYSVSKVEFADEAAKTFMMLRLDK